MSTDDDWTVVSGRAGRYVAPNPDRTRDVNALIYAYWAGEMEVETMATELVGHRHSVAELHAERKELYERVSNLANEFHDIKGVNRNLHAEREKVSAECARLRERVTTLETENECLSASCEAVTQHLDNARARVAELESALEGKT